MSSDETESNEIECSRYECDSRYYSKKQNIGENTECLNDNDLFAEPSSGTPPPCIKECCKEHEICAEWYFHGNRCDNNKYPVQSRRIIDRKGRGPKVSKSLTDIIYTGESLITVDDICCKDVKGGDYTCPDDYKKKNYTRDPTP